MVNLKFAKLHEDVIIPSKREEDGGFDINANFNAPYMVIRPQETKIIPTGLISSFPAGHVIVLKERGSTGTKGMAQRAGVIDSGYRGEWLVPITNTNNRPIVILKSTDPEEIKVFERDYVIHPYSKAICQALLLELPTVEIEECPATEIMADNSLRGTGRLGSSGK